MHGTLIKVLILLFASLYVCNAILKCHLHSEGWNIVIHGTTWLECWNKKLVPKNCILSMQQDGRFVYVPYDTVRQHVMNNFINSSPKDAARIRRDFDAQEFPLCDIAYQMSLLPKAYEEMKEWRWKLQYLPGSSVCDIRPRSAWGGVFVTNNGREFAKCVKGKLKIGKCLVSIPSSLKETKCINIFGVKNIIRNTTYGKSVCQQFHEAYPDISDIALNCFDFTDNDHFTDFVDEQEMLFKFPPPTTATNLTKSLMQPGGQKAPPPPPAAAARPPIPWNFNLGILGPNGGHVKIGTGNNYGRGFNYANDILIKNKDHKTVAGVGFGFGFGRRRRRNAEDGVPEKSQMNHGQNGMSGGNWIDSGTAFSTNASST